MVMMNSLKKWIRNNLYDHRRVSYLLILVLVILFFISYCRVSTRPGKVWNLRGKVVGLAKSLTGLPYKHGGEEIYGFDCSGFVYYVYDSFGIRLPRTAKKQAKLDGQIKFKRARPADILAFRIKRRWHTAIYIGNDSFIHAPNKRSRVRVEKLNTFWRKRLKHAVRIIDE